MSVYFIEIILEKSESYLIKKSKHPLKDVCFLLSVIRSGFEPETHSLEGCCSIQLSYRTIISIIEELFYSQLIFKSECKVRLFSPISKISMITFNLY